MQLHFVSLRAFEKQTLLIAGDYGLLWPVRILPIAQKNACESLASSFSVSPAQAQRASLDRAGRGECAI
jgi:hypothetical protein